MTYTIWRQINSNTYKFYLATKVASVALNNTPTHSPYIITKTPHSFSFNYIHIDDLNNYPQL